MASPALLSTIEANLKKWYYGKVIETINQEARVYEFAKKGRFSWSGQDWNFSLHTSRGSAGTAGLFTAPAAYGWVAENGALPEAGHQGYVRLTGTTKSVYGRMQLSGQSIRAAQGQPGAIVPTLASEIEGATKDVVFSLNTGAVYGAQVPGFIFERKAVGAGGGDWQFSGNYLPFVQALALAAGGGTVKVDVYNLDTYALVGAGNVILTAATENSIHLTGVALDTSAVTKPGVCFGVRIVEVKTVGGAVDYLPVFQAQMNGIYSNLVDTGAHTTGVDLAHYAGGNFTNLRKTTGGNERLQSNIRCQVTSTKAGDYLYADLTAGRLSDMQAMIDEQSGKQADALMIHPSSLTSYQNILYGTFGSNLIKDVSQAGVGDAGFDRTKLAFGGVKFITSKDMGKGVIAFLCSESWKLASLKEPSMADEDGKILFKVSGKDVYEGFINAYMELVCIEPRANAILVGFNYTSL